MRFRPLVDSSRVIGRRASRWPIIYRHIHYTPSCSQSDKRPTPKPVDEVRENRLQSAARNFVESVGEGVPSEEVPSERIDETVPLELPGDVQMRDAFCTFQAADLTPCTEPVVSDAGCRVVCTYSWSKLKRPTIKIPGTFPWPTLSSLASHAFLQGSHGSGQIKQHPDYYFHILTHHPGGHRLVRLARYDTPFKHFSGQ